ncbi:uncharacterized protein [Miscanthus floridulus]|uniref:uncharacterized protein n=1 Tax=Miscanthus floridulus TaxID=154761 RepID=UPI00345A860E
MRDAVWKLLCPHSSQKHQAEAPALAPRKALKVSTNSTTRWVVEAQAAIQRGAVSAKADPKEPVAQGEATKAAMKQAGEEAPTPCEAGVLESGDADVPLNAEATEGEIEVPRASEAEVVDVGAPRTTEAEVAEAGALGTTEAKEAVDAKVASITEQLVLTSGEGSSALVRSTEVEDLHLCCADMKVEVATAQEQATPLAARIKELEEELTRVAGERDTFRSQAEQVEASAKAIVG